MQNKFENKLKNDFPDLFYKDEQGNLKSPDCGIWCPEGWENLVYNLCDYINHRVKNHVVMDQKNKWLYNLKSKVHRKTILPISKLCYSLTDPYSQYLPKDRETF